MSLPGTPLVWSPRGASDTLDSSTAFKGAMALLQDLIPDPTTRDLWQCRPAATVLLDLVGSPFSSGFSSGFGTAGFPNATFISCFIVIGTRIYGMVSTSTNIGHDEPFCYDTTLQSLIPVSGITAANAPTSPQQTGAWVPPHMELIGTKIILTHPGFNGSAGAYFGVIDISNPAAPAYSATNTTTHPLLAPPSWVANFNGRAYYLVNPTGGQPAAVFSDVLDPTTVTNASQVLFFGDNIPLTCAAGLPLNNQLGGIIQALIIFKGVTNMYQVIGDAALMNLSVNALNVATGTYAPNSVRPTSKGLAFIAPDGLRIIDFNATVSDPVGNNGDGITTPFINAITPSRIAAAYNGGIYRVQVQNGNAVGSPQQQWWFDFVRGIWSGPHTQAASLMAGFASTFIVTIQGAGAKLFQSDQVQTLTSTFVENGTALQFAFATPMLPDTDQMAENAMIEATLHMALVGGNSVQIFPQDQNGVVLDSVVITPTGAPTVWGNFQWGQAVWQGALNALFPRPLHWTIPIVFRRMGIYATGASVGGFKIGRLHMRYQILGYLQQGA